MHSADSDTSRRSRGRKARWIVPLIFALLVGVSVAVSERVRGSRAQREARTAIDAGGGIATGERGGALGRRGLNAPMLAATLKDLRLVTVRIDHQVTATATTDSWRGDVQATVSAVATSLFGVDLSGLSEGDVWTNMLTGTLHVRVPAPERIATEIQTAAAEQSTKVEVGWGRLRDVAGEYYLGQARARLHEAARAQLLSNEQRSQVEALSREQLSRLVRALGSLEDGEMVDIEFVELGGGSEKTGATGTDDVGDKGSTSGASHGGAR
jgi:hypothetical protein